MTVRAQVFSFRPPGQTRHPLALLRRSEDFGFESLDLVRPPGRFFGEMPPPLVEPNVESRRVAAQVSPATGLSVSPEGEPWREVSRRSIARFESWFLVLEDPQRRLNAEKIVTLAHQASLVEHVLNDSQLNRVLIADEVGLGKTVEVGLIIKSLLAQQPDLRIVYFAPARLVSNVYGEFAKLGLSSFRVWVAEQSTRARGVVAAPPPAQLSGDRHVIASLHRAAHKIHLDDVLAQRWDVVVVDEAHHLTDWERGGGKPTRKYTLVERLRGRMARDGRLILMSGTPHQGNPDRFENLLKLLRREDEPDAALPGRVIYRTKDDVRDWDNRPLFPSREVRTPVVIDLGPQHRDWLKHIHHFFAPDDQRSTSEPRRRAAGWRCGQALQWATSSVQAGLGFLVRQALRAGWGTERASVVAAVSNLRPYRGGPVDERPAVLVDRIRHEIGCPEDYEDVEHLEEFDDEDGIDPWRPDPLRLDRLLDEGVALLEGDGRDAKWRFIQDKLLLPAGGEQVVLFAQPIETVSALADFLFREGGEHPSKIVGQQTEVDRDREITRFRSGGARYLISSRAGGEGLNLQVARRLVHVDVPWNPMELEQRVGRVHRFGSRQKIIVDTVVVQDSREADVYERARGKLKLISKALAPDAEKQESLFARVMSLVPPQELSHILGEGPLGPLSDEEDRRVSQLVNEGFKRWRTFHERFSGQQDRLKRLEPGVARWSDLDRFARAQLKARPAEGFETLRFHWDQGEVVDASEQATVLDIEGKHYACGDYGGMPVKSQTGQVAMYLGLNVDPLLDAVRSAAFPLRPAGSAFVKWPEAAELPVPGLARPFGVLAFGRLLLRAEQGSWAEKGASLHVFVISQDGQCLPLDGTGKRLALDGLVLAASRASTVPQEPEHPADLVLRMQEEETRLFNELRRPAVAEEKHALFPLLAAVIT